MKRLFLYSGFIITVALFMMFLLWAVYLIPIEKIRPNAQKSADILMVTPRIVWYNHKFPGGVIDKITDARMLNIASFLGKGDAWQDSLLNYETYYVLWAPLSLRYSLQTDTFEGASIFNYARFWHGYLVFLKPLLVFFDLQGIRIINLIFQVLLVLAILFLMFRRMGFVHCMAFFSAILFFNFLTTWMCLEYASVINVMLLAVLWVLLNRNPNDNYIFFVIGVVTILFDFLTFPLVTLGIPLIIYICLYDRGFKGNVFCVIKNSLLWLSGYALMWLSKWSLATLLTEQNVVKDGWENVLHRTYGYFEGDSVGRENISIVKSIMLNYWEIYTPVSLFYLMPFIISVIIFFFIGKRQLRLSAKFFVLCGIALMPFVWYMVLVNHSVIHAFLFSHKILVVSIYAVFAALVSCLQDKKRIRKR